nr:hypothetical protein Iba_chr13bCG1860 [Ipomoea batatas]
MEMQKNFDLWPFYGKSQAILEFFSAGFQKPNFILCSTFNLSSSSDGTCPPLSECSLYAYLRISPRDKRSLLIASKAPFGTLAVSLSPVPFNTFSPGFEATFSGTSLDLAFLSTETDSGVRARLLVSATMPDFSLQQPIRSSRLLSVASEQLQKPPPLLPQNKQIAFVQVASFLASGVVEANGSIIVESIRWHILEYIIAWLVRERHLLFRTFMINKNFRSYLSIRIGLCTVTRTAALSITGSEHTHRTRTAPSRFCFATFQTARSFVFCRNVLILSFDTKICSSDPSFSQGHCVGETSITILSSTRTSLDSPAEVSSFDILISGIAKGFDKPFTIFEIQISRFLLSGNILALLQLSTLSWLPSSLLDILPLESSLSDKAFPLPFLLRPEILMCVGEALIGTESFPNNLASFCTLTSFITELSIFSPAANACAANMCNPEPAFTPAPESSFSFVLTVRLENPIASAISTLLLLRLIISNAQLLARSQ